MQSEVVYGCTVACESTGAISCRLPGDKVDRLRVNLAAGDEDFVSQFSVLR